MSCAAFLFGQMPSSTEKWNSSFGRWDIYDGNGTLIGYRKFNQAFNRWETVDLRPSSSSSSQSSGWEAYNNAKTRNRSVPDLESPSLSSSEIEYARAMAQAIAVQESQRQIYNQEVDAQYRAERERQNKIKSQYIEEAAILDQKAKNFFDSKDYKNCAKTSLEAFNLLKNKGLQFNDSWTYLYNAIISFYASKDFENVSLYSRYFINTTENNFDLNNAKVIELLTKNYEYYLSSLLTLQKVLPEKNFINDAIKKYQKNKKADELVRMLSYVKENRIPKAELLETIANTADSKHLDEVLKKVEKDAKNNKMFDKSFIEEVYDKAMRKYGNFREGTKVLEYTTKIIESRGMENSGYYINWRASLYDNRKDYENSIKDYDYLITNYSRLQGVYTDLATLYNNKAYKYVQLKRPSEAKLLVKRALELDATKNYIWDTKGEMEYLLGNYSEAIANMNTAISLEKLGNSFLYRGLSYLKLNRNKEACDDFFKAGELGKKEGYDLIKQHCK